MPTPVQACFFQNGETGPDVTFKSTTTPFMETGAEPPVRGVHITGSPVDYTSTPQILKISACRKTIFSQNCGFQIGFSNLYLKNNEDIQQVFHKKKIIIRDNVIHQTEEIKYPIRVGWPPDDFAEVYAFDGKRPIIKDPLFPAPEQGNFQLMARDSDGGGLSSRFLIKQPAKTGLKPMTTKFS